MKVVIVGAGLGGLAAACHLVGNGHDVTVVERDPAPGGRAGRWESNGYSFDTGPTVFTMVDFLERTFNAAGASTLGTAPVTQTGLSCLFALAERR